MCLRKTKPGDEWRDLIQVRICSVLAESRAKFIPFWCILWPLIYCCFFLHSLNLLSSGVLVAHQQTNYSRMANLSMQIVVCTVLSNRYWIPPWCKRKNCASCISLSAKWTRRKCKMQIILSQKWNERCHSRKEFCTYSRCELYVRFT